MREMNKELVTASVGIILTLLIISVVAAQEMPKISPTPRIEMEFRPITPYLPVVPVLPPLRPVECPRFMVVELPFKAYFARAHHYVMVYLHKKSLTLPQLCVDKTKIENLVREAIEEINLTKICEGLEKASEDCKEIRPLDCEKLKDAIPLCIEGLKKCKSTEERVKVTKEAWKEKIKEIEEEVEAIVPSSPVVPKIEGIVPKCYVEEYVCEQLKEKYEKCVEFQEKCAPRCEVIDKLASECVAALTDKEALVEKVVEFIWKHCELIDYIPPEIEEVENETISPAEIQPVIIVTQPLAPEQEARIRALVEKLEQIYKDETWIYRAFVRANKIEDLRELEFVLAVKIDHIMRALQRVTFKKLPELPEFAPQVDKVLPALEGVKVKVEVELQPVITDVETEILNHSKEITTYHKEERARGIGYEILKFLGFQADREKKDAAFLEERARGISKVVENLRNIAKTEERPEIRALILEQIAELQKSVDEISERAEAKHRWAFGIWSLLGLR